MNSDFRVERDSMGEMRVPSNAYYGASTARAVENFPISGLTFSRPFIRALGLIKKHSAATNAELGIVDARIARAIEEAAAEVVEGRWDTQFVVDIFQTGSGTSTNMNANEVIANRATELLGGKRGDRLVHPNDHVNQGQSSNDVIPSTIHLAALEQTERLLIPALETLHRELQRKSDEFARVIKVGRTHFQDATPIFLGQEFSGYTRQVENAIERTRDSLRLLRELALGGTAVGTGLNTHERFAQLTVQKVSAETGLSLREASNHFEAQASRDACVQFSGTLKTIAVTLIKIASDIRFLASGPRLGIGEIKLPATQPGSSIMPGKVNPVMSEMLVQVGAQVIGNDATITFAGTSGNLELNVAMPVLAHNLLQSISLLASGSRVFAERCVSGIEADRGKCLSNVERSLAMCTVLAPVIGYDKAAMIAKTAYQTNRTVREVAEDLSGLSPDRLNDLLNPEKQTHPSA